MSKKKSGNKKSVRSITQPSSNNEWVIGLGQTPIHVAEGGGYSPQAALILENELIIGSELTHPGKVFDWKIFISNTISSTRQPQAIRVADKKLAGLFRELFPEIEIITAPTPEFDDAMKHMTQHFTRSDNSSYTQGGEISNEILADFFEATKMFYEMKPWKNISDEEPIRIDIPEAGIEGACLVILGNAGIDFGFLFFPSLDSFELFIELAQNQGQPNPESDGSSLLISASYVKATELPEGMRREAAKNCWPVAEPDAYPLLMHILDDFSKVQPDPEDYELLTLVAESFTGFYLQSQETFESDEILPISMTVESDELAVRYTFPYEAYDDFEE